MIMIEWVETQDDFSLHAPLNCLVTWFFLAIPAHQKSTLPACYLWIKLSTCKSIGF